MIFIFILASFFIGSLPIGYIVGKFKKVDIRKTGSGNIGATNIKRALGLKYAVIVGVCDFLKGVIPVLIATYIFQSQITIAAVALATILGSIFSIFLKFKGGKGASAYSGSLLVLLGLPTFLIAAFLWLAFLYISKIMSLTNLAMSMIIPFIFLFLLGSSTYFAMSLVAVMLIWYSHRENVKRLMAGTEPRLSFHK